MTAVLSEPMTMLELCHVENRAKRAECQDRAQQRWQHWRLWGEEEARLGVCDAEFEARAGECAAAYRSHGLGLGRGSGSGTDHSMAPLQTPPAASGGGAPTQTVVLVVALCVAAFLLLR